MRASLTRLIFTWNQCQFHSFRHRLGTGCRRFKTQITSPGPTIIIWLCQGKSLLKIMSKCSNSLILWTLRTHSTSIVYRLQMKSIMLKLMGHRGTLKWRRPIHGLNLMTSSQLLSSPTPIWPCQKTSALMNSAKLKILQLGRKMYRTHTSLRKTTMRFQKLTTTPYSAQPHGETQICASHQSNQDALPRMRRLPNSIKTNSEVGFIAIDLVLLRKN